MPKVVTSCADIGFIYKFQFIGLIKIQNRTAVIDIDYPAALSVIAPYPARLCNIVILHSLWDIMGYAKCGFPPFLLVILCLRVPKLTVASFLFHQRLVVSLLYNPAFLKDKNLVAEPAAGHPV